MTSSSLERLDARIRDDEDVAEVIALLRLNYERVLARYGLPG